MPPRLLARWGLILTSVLLPLRGFATSVVAPQFTDLVGEADYVVRAVVTSVTSDWREKDGHRYIGTNVSLDVREVIKGTPPQPLVLDFVGGRVGNEIMRIEGAPQFHVGDEAIFFVQGNGKQVTPLVGMMHGVYPIVDNPRTGKRYAVRSNGMPLYSENDVALPMTKYDAAKAPGTDPAPLTAEDFIQRIRKAGPGTRRSFPK